MPLERQREPVTSRCSSHVEFRAGFDERWCAYLRGCA
jgi:hypothetical protein